MAHVGKNYPLHLRRDLGIFSLDNRDSLSKAYWLTIDRATGIIAPALVPMAIVAVEIDPGADYALWISPPTILSGRTLVLKLFMSPTTIIGGDAWMGMELSDSINGVMVRGLGDTIEFRKYRRFNLALVRGPGYDPALLDFPFTNNSGDCHWLNWSQWNSL